MKGKSFKDLPPDIQKKIAYEVYNSMQKGNNSGAFGVELDKTMRSILGEDVGFLEADINDIKEIARKSPFFQNPYNKKQDEYIDALTKHRKDKELLYQERENHLDKVRKEIGVEIVDKIVLDSDKFFDEMTRRIKYLRGMIQQIDTDLKKRVRSVDDTVQFVETDRAMLYNTQEVLTSSLSAWAKDMILLHKGISEALESMDMFKAFVPAILAEFECHKKDIGV
jgi:hypothetical protein